MNNDDFIKKETALYGYIAEYAQQSKFSATLNRFFRENSVDGMIVPMNIREDDIYFTISGLRDAQLSGVAISSEYVYDAFNITDSKSDTVELCQFCDTIVVKDKKLHGAIAISGAIDFIVKEKKVKNIALLGSGKLAKAILFDCSTEVKVTLFADRVESCMELINIVSAKKSNITFDIERAQSKTDIDFSLFDMAINTTPEHDGFKMIKPASIMIDITEKNTLFKSFENSDEIEYFNEEKLVPFLTQSCLKIWNTK
jgi:shikimate 5-dehydrogenase